MPDHLDIEKDNSRDGDNNNYQNQQAVHIHDVPVGFLYTAVGIDGGLEDVHAFVVVIRELTRGLRVNISLSGTGHQGKVDNDILLKLKDLLYLFSIVNDKGVVRFDLFAIAVENNSYCHNDHRHNSGNKTNNCK
jgi:hypothetical protein